MRFAGVESPPPLSENHVDEAEKNQRKRADRALCHADEVFFHLNIGAPGFISILAQIVPSPSISVFSIISVDHKHGWGIGLCMAPMICQKNATVW
jgi:hypothetical protein